MEWAGKARVRFGTAELTEKAKDEETESEIRCGCLRKMGWFSGVDSCRKAPGARS